MGAPFLLKVSAPNLCDGESATFTCTTSGSNTLYHWFIFGLSGEGGIIDSPARSLISRSSGRFSTTDEAGVIPESNLMISGFTTADNGTVIYCNDAGNPTVFSSTNITIGVGELYSNSKSHLFRTRSGVQCQRLIIFMKELVESITFLSFL